jgi:hypothetical protein
MLLLIFIEVTKGVVHERISPLREMQVFELSDELEVVSSRAWKNPEPGETDRDAAMLSWDAAMAEVKDYLGEASERQLLFPNKHALQLFHIMKSRCKVKLQTTHNGALDSLIDWSQIIYSNEIAIPVVFEELSSYNVSQLIGKDLLVPNKHKRNAVSRKGIFNCASYHYIGDRLTMTYHKKTCKCLDEVADKDINGIGKNPNQKIWRSCPFCEAEKSTINSLLIKPEAEIARIAVTKNRKKSQIIQEEIAKVCDTYDMHAEFYGGTAFITTVAGEWYFVYNDRPIELRHKNYSLVPKNGDAALRYHKQNKKFPTPLHVIKYIYAHEKVLIQKTMESQGLEDYLSGDAS